MSDDHKVPEVLWLASQNSPSGAKCRSLLFHACEGIYGDGVTFSEDDKANAFSIADVSFDGRATWYAYTDPIPPVNTGPGGEESLAFTLPAHTSPQSAPKTQVHAGKSEGFKVTVTVEVNGSSK